MEYKENTEAETRERLRQALHVAAQGDLALAASLYRRTLCLAPDHPTTHYLLGLALMGLGREEEARTEWLTTLHEEGSEETNWVHHQAQSLLTQYADRHRPEKTPEKVRKDNALR
jgi:thioredoxin-like negative regulator of GroEL